MIPNRFKDKPLDNASLKMFRFRKDGQLKAYTVIEYSPEERYYIRGKAETQLLTMLRLSVRGLEQTSWKDRDKLLADALINTDTSKIILRICEDFAYAAVTDRYTGVKHTELWDIAEKQFGNSNIEFFKKQPLHLRDRLLVKYIFPKHKVQNNIVPGIFISNSTTGTAAIKMGQYAEVLICNNGLIGEEFNIDYSRRHEGDKEDILGGFESALKYQLENLLQQVVNLDIMIAISRSILYDPNEVKLLREVMANKRVPLKYLSSFHSSVELMSFSQDNKLSAYEVANILSRVAGTAPPEVKVQLEGVAYQVLSNSIRSQFDVKSQLVTA